MKSVKIIEDGHEYELTESGEVKLGLNVYDVEIDFETGKVEIHNICSGSGDAEARVLPTNDISVYDDVNSAINQSDTIKPYVKNSRVRYEAENECFNCLTDSDKRYMHGVSLRSKVDEDEDFEIAHEKAFEKFGSLMNKHMKTSYEQLDDTSITILDSSNLIKSFAWSYGTYDEKIIRLSCDSLEGIELASNHYKDFAEHYSYSSGLFIKKLTIGTMKELIGYEDIDEESLIIDISSLNEEMLKNTESITIETFTINDTLRALDVLRFADNFKHIEISNRSEHHSTNNMNIYIDIYEEDGIQKKSLQLEPNICDIGSFNSVCVAINSMFSSDGTFETLNTYDENGNVENTYFYAGGENAISFQPLIYKSDVVKLLAPTDRVSFDKVTSSITVDTALSIFSNDTEFINGISCERLDIYSFFKILSIQHPYYDVDENGYYYFNTPPYETVNHIERYITLAKWGKEKFIILNVDNAFPYIEELLKISNVEEVIFPNVFHYKKGEFYKVYSSDGIIDISSLNILGVINETGQSADAFLNKISITEKMPLSAKNYDFHIVRPPEDNWVNTEIFEIGGFPAKANNLDTYLGAEPQGFLQEHQKASSGVSYSPVSKMVDFFADINQGGTKTNKVPVVKNKDSLSSRVDEFTKDMIDADKQYTQAVIDAMLFFEESFTRYESHVDDVFETLTKGSPLYVYEYTNFSAGEVEGEATATIVKGYHLHDVEIETNDKVCSVEYDRNLKGIIEIKETGDGFSFENAGADVLMAIITEERDEEDEAYIVESEYEVDMSGEKTENTDIVKYNVIQNGDGSIDISWENNTSIDAKFLTINDKKILIQEEV